jgi:hypothetical protein
VWRRDVTCKGRVVVITTTRAPRLLVSTDRTLPPTAIIEWYAASFPLTLTWRDRKQSLGWGAYQGQRRLGSQRVGPLAVTAFALGRLTLLRDQPAPWLAAQTASPAGELTPRSLQRLHRALRRGVLRWIFASSAPGADVQKPAPGYEQIFRLAA